MAKPAHLHSPELVSAYIRKLDPKTAKLVDAIRKVILSVDINIGEQIKWNAPSFFYLGEMAPSVPKAYKREIVVMNLFRTEYVLLVLPSGAKLEDPSNLLEGNYTDGRRLVKIFSEKDLTTKKVALKKLLQDWLKKVER